MRKPTLLSQPILADLNWPVVVAVALMDMVEVTIDKVIDVVAVRDRFVATPRAVAMLFRVLAAVVGGGTAGGVGPCDG
jgi:hypothetical protein